MTNYSTEPLSEPFSALEELIDYSFLNKSLLPQAFTSKGYSNNHGKCPYRDSLATVGDSLIDLVSCHFAVTEYKKTIKEEINGFKQRFSRRATQGKYLNQLLAENNLSIYDLARVDSGEYNHSVLSNLEFLGEFLEALIGAVFIDGGLTYTELVIFKILPIKN